MNETPGAEPVALAARPPVRRRPVTSRISPRDLGVVATFVALFVALSMASSAFLRTQNLVNILEEWSPIGLLALGGSVIITGGFDLSIGANFALAGVVAVAVGQHSVVLGMLAGGAAGTAGGLLNGLLGTWAG